MTAIRAELTANFSGLTFDEGPHTYIVSGKQMTPVSNIVETFIEEFDEDLWAGRIAQKEDRTKEAVIAEWRAINKASLERGTDVHNYAEAYAEHLHYGAERPFNDWKYPEQKAAVRKFYDDLSNSFFPVGLELRMFDDGLGIAGTTDILFQNNETGNFVIADWKTNKDLHKNFAGKTMLPPFQYVLDSPYNHYQVQLSLYQILLEKKGWKVEERWIVWLPQIGGYELHKAHDFTHMIKKHLE